MCGGVWVMGVCIHVNTASELILFFLTAFSESFIFHAVHELSLKRFFVFFFFACLLSKECVIRDCGAVLMANLCDLINWTPFHEFSSTWPITIKREQ